MYAIKKLLDVLYANVKSRFFSADAGTIVLYEPLYDLTFLKGELKGYNVFYYPRVNADKAIGFKNGNYNVNVDVDFPDLDYRGDLLINIFMEDIQADFLRNIAGYMSAIVRLRSAAKRHSISLAIWGNPPISGIKALIFEYLSSEGVTVLGGQHGCLYGEALVPWHFESDFNRCDYFVSYGFTREDLSRLYPDKKPRCVILPFGASKPVYSSAKKEIDILFPIVNTISIFQGGMLRITPEKLASRQVKLLEYLDSLAGCSVIIKPFPYSNFDSCGPLIDLKRLKRLQVVDNMGLKEFLQKYSPRAVLIEYPSQPLFDCLNLDAEIFLMNDPINPYEERTLEFLRRRVHYAENVGEVIAKMNMFLKGKLKAKRDNTFYNHYVYKEHRRERILRKIDELVQSSLERC